MGSGAIAGSTLPIDREFTAKVLGFVDSEGNPRITANGMDAVADRDVFIEFGNASSTCALHLSRLAEDMILWNSTEFSFIELPDAFTTGSSLMPQKKNPDSFELIRGKTGRIIANLTNLLITVKGLPLTYNRDLRKAFVISAEGFQISQQVMPNRNGLSPLQMGISGNWQICVSLRQRKNRDHAKAKLKKIFA